MWPWGHLALGYLLYSPAVHLLRRRAPAPGPVLLLALGTQLPDLVDKPLAWVFHVAPSGYAVAHSAYVALPVGLAVVALARHRERGRLGVAFTLGWWSHLVGDVLLGLVLGNPYALDRVRWPLVTLPADGGRPLLDRVGYYLVNWVEILVATDALWFTAVYVGALGVAWALWLVDGAPGFPEPSWFD